MALDYGFDAGAGPAAGAAGAAGLELEDVTSDNRLYKSRIKLSRSL